MKQKVLNFLLFVRAFTNSSCDKDARREVGSVAPKNKVCLREKFNVLLIHMRKPDPELTQEREEAWIGDAVLALFARKWILANDEKMNGEKFVRFTSNDFLRRLGNPTSEEAAIGRVYTKEGLDAAMSYIEERHLPVFIQLEKSRIRQRLK